VLAFLGLDSFFVVVGCFSKWLFGLLGLDSFLWWLVVFLSGCLAFLGLDIFFVVFGCFSKWLFGFLGLDSFLWWLVFLRFFGFLGSD
jgi:hypothetical protein